ncbi:kelch-like protein 10 [Bacillus rossius redtenbacheri]|uniref:kelch-like protein 10 n=1 Tax=Bacillus rossius redtenbacheri TaxID=93214 RepID=UPI002FDC7CEE
MSSPSRRRTAKKAILGRRCFCRGSGSGDQAGVHRFPPAWRELWLSGELADATLASSDGAKFRVHRVILSAVSPYFRLVFTNTIDGKQSLDREKSVDLPGRLLEILLEHAYTGACRVAADNVQELLPAADRYSFGEVVQRCCHFLLRELTPANCLGVLRFARHYFCRNLEQTGDRFVKVNFKRIAEESSEWCEMQVEELERLLSDDELNVADEAVVFRAVTRWVDADPESRAPLLPRLLLCVRYGFFDLDSFTEIVLRCKYVEQSPDLQRLVEEPTVFLTQMATSNATELDLKPHFCRPRIPYEVLFAVGGWSSGSPTNFIETYDPRSQRWFLSQHTDSLPRSYHGMCALENLIYVVGGFDGHEHFNSVRCFNPATSEWQERACMYNARCYVSVCALDGLVYALGGYNGRMRLSSCERYYPQYNQWQMIPPMHRQRSDASAAVLGGKIYIAGGFNGTEVLSSAEMFDPVSMQWTLIAALSQPRSGISVIAYEDRLYAMGGFDGVTRLNSVECLTPSLQFPAWHEITPMITPRSNFACAVLEDAIFVVGGFNGTTTVPHVESFDSRGGQWRPRAPMNLNRSALTACVLSGLPNCREFSYLSKVSQLGQGCSCDQPSA